MPGHVLAGIGLHDHRHVGQGRLGEQAGERLEAEQPLPDMGMAVAA